MSRPQDKAEREQVIRRYLYGLIPQWRRRRDGGGVDLIILGDDGDWVFPRDGDSVIAAIEYDVDDYNKYTVRMGGIDSDTYLEEIFDTLDEARAALLAALPSYGDKRMRADAEYAYDVIRREIPDWLPILTHTGYSSDIETEKESAILDLEERAWQYIITMLTRKRKNC